MEAGNRAARSQLLSCKGVNPGRDVNVARVSAVRTEVCKVVPNASVRVLEKKRGRRVGRVWRGLASAAQTICCRDGLELGLSHIYLPEDQTVEKPSGSRAPCLQQKSNLELGN
jgi:hypothetical protein